MTEVQTTPEAIETKDDLLEACEEALAEIYISVQDFDARVAEATKELSLPDVELFGEELGANIEVTVPLRDKVVADNVLQDLEAVFARTKIPLVCENPLKQNEGGSGILARWNSIRQSGERDYESACGGIIARVNPETQKVVALNIYGAMQGDDQVLRLTTDFTHTPPHTSAFLQSNEKGVSHMFNIAAVDVGRSEDVRAMLDDFVRRNITE